ARDRADGAPGAGSRAAAASGAAAAGAPRRRRRRWSRTGRRRSAGPARAPRPPRPDGRRSGPPPAVRPRDAGSCARPERGDQAARLGARLLELTLRIGVGDDAGAGIEGRLRTVHGHGADEDVEVEPAVTAQVAERARVGAAARALELGDDLHA